MHLAHTPELMWVQAEVLTSCLVQITLRFGPMIGVPRIIVLPPALEDHLVAGAIFGIPSFDGACVLVGVEGELGVCLTVRRR